MLYVGDIIIVGIAFERQHPSSFHYLCINILHDLSKIGLLIGLINNTAKCSPIGWGIYVIPRFSDQKLSFQGDHPLQLPRVLILSCS